MVKQEFGFFDMGDFRWEAVELGFLVGILR